MTKFLEGYWLPKSFGLDVRHHQLNILLLPEQMTRQEALDILRTEPLSDEDEKAMVHRTTERFLINEKELQGYMYMSAWQNQYKNSRWLYKIGGNTMFILGLDNRIRNLKISISCSLSGISMESFLEINKQDY